MADDLKNSLHAAQKESIARKREEEEFEEERPKRKKPLFLGVENRDELINRPRLSESAALRQLLAERSTPVNVPGLRKLRKMRHGTGAPRPPVPTGPREIVITLPITVRDLSQATGIKVGDVIAKLMRLNVMASINQTLDRDTIEMFALENNLPIKIAQQEEPLEAHAFGEEAEEVRPETMVKRPPVVTFMGHVDHGKTSLLDAIRHTNVAAGESGGITQHIGASQVTIPAGTITFIDTPGHEAFTAMRARGARVTDIAVLVVAADDGLMPQSLEAIDHARAAKVPIMVAINKIDLPTANPDRVLAQLAERGLTPEAWGGDTICCNVSALTGEGIDKLLEMILLQADLLELRARPDGPATGVVLEAVLDPHRGPLVTLLVQQGRLQRGNAIVSGTSFARARTLLNYRGESVDSAGPSDPVLVLGFDSLPTAGSEFRVATSERHARELVEQRREEERLKRHAETQKISLETFRLRMASEQVKELRLIIKGDTQGTTEALRGAVERLSGGDVKVTVLHSGVGAVTDNDVTLASASDAVIVAFRVDVQDSALALAKSEGVDIKSYDVIYHATEEIAKALQGLLEPKFKEVETGVAEVRAIFKLSVGTVAGCHVLSGVVQRSNRVRVFRAGQQIFEGEIQSLKHLKDEVREIRAGFDCGILLRGFSDVQEGDRIHAFKLERESLATT
ncbi:MAG: translation initiation factor IF-2 [bacterium]|nr:translation initiation factor IF-2 [bacterium]